MEFFLYLTCNSYQDLIDYLNKNKIKSQPVIVQEIVEKGAYLSIPKKEKVSEDAENAKIRFGVSGMQGWRNTMEDTHIAQLDLGNGVSFFGVYDGHGGNEVADFVKEHLVQELVKNQSFLKGDYEQALKDVYLKMDSLLKSHYGRQKLHTYNRRRKANSGKLLDITGQDIAYSVGCTACSALITKNEIIVANAGDSRAVLGVKNEGKIQAIQMSIDHKPDLKEEKLRIEKAGGFIEENRVKGILNLSRSIGDLEYKNDSSLAIKDQMIIPIPEVTKFELNDDAQFLILACDGIWDCMTSQEAVEFVEEQLSYKQNLSKIVEGIFDRIIAPDVHLSGGIGCDNMTCIILQFKQDQDSSYWSKQMANN